MKLLHRLGSVTIRVIGVKPEHFFQQCTEQQIPIRNAYKINENIAEGEIAQIHLRRLKSLLERTDFEVIIVKEQGYIPTLFRLWRRKEVIIAIFFSVFVLFFVSQMIWNVSIEGVSEETERKLRESLFSHGIYKGAWIHSLRPLNELEDEIKTDVPSLLYVGIERNGTHFFIKAVEKRDVIEQAEILPQDLIAKKNGVIKKMFIKKGIPVVEINDVVKRGDLLVSGTLDEFDEKEENNKDESAKKSRTIISAEGEVYATTWYEINVSSPIMFTKAKNLGTIRKKYYIQFGTIRLPLNFWKKRRHNELLEETVFDEIKIFKWTIPIRFIERTFYEISDRTHIRTIDETKELAIKHVMNELKKQLGRDAEITNYYILHESVDNGKVNLYLYVSVIENIAKGRLISS